MKRSYSTLCCMEKGAVMEFQKYGFLDGELIYRNRLERPEDISDFILEGKAKISFPNGCMRMENSYSADEGQKANYVLWCPREFPEDICVQWDFQPLANPGLCILFFAAKGRGGEDLFDKRLQKRTGEYPQYHHGDINAFHISYYRRKELDERAFHTCNLRKSYGFYLVAQGADPIPDESDVKEFYRLTAVKQGAQVRFYINELPIFAFTDDGSTYGECLSGGKIGFRQLAPLVAEYRNLSVYRILK